MSWFNLFKAKNPKVSCLVCERSVRTDKAIAVKYRYGEGEGSIGTAHLCEKCSHYLDKKDDSEYDESL